MNLRGSRLHAGLAILLASFLFSTPAAQAEEVKTTQGSASELPALGENSSVSDYLVYAGLNNPGLKAAFHSWKAALERVPQVRAMPDPRFTYAYFLRAVETRVGPQRQKFALSQLFPWFGKLSRRGDIALEAANVEKERYEDLKNQLFSEVKDVTYEYYYLGRAIALAEENIQLLGNLERVARGRYKVGVASHADIIKAQVELGRLEERLASLRDQHGPLLARLNSLLSRPYDAALPWPKTIHQQEIDFQEAELLLGLGARNPELRALGFAATREKAAIEFAKRDSYPDLTVGVEYIDTRAARFPEVEDSGKNAILALFSINIPLSRGKYDAAVEEATFRYHAAVARRADRENQLIASANQALYGLRDAERKIDLYRDTLIPKGVQSLNVTQQGFEAGRVDFLDLIEAQRTLLEFHLSFERALADRAKQFARLERLVGGEIGAGRTGE